MRKPNASHVALALAGLALFVALGGPAWAKGLLIGTKQLKDNAVTSKKIQKGAVHDSDLAKGAVTTSKLHAGAVTGGKVENGSLHAPDVAPNTFLGANDTAKDSLALGGILAGNYFRASGSANQNRVVVPAGASGSNLLLFSLGQITAGCVGNRPQVTYDSAAPAIDYSEFDVRSSGVHVTTLQNVGTGSDTVPNATGLPQRVTFQVASKNDGA